MIAYVADGELLCEPCAANVNADRKAQGLDPLEGYADGGGESDTPSHCGGCHAFLENPLTRDGERYVEESIGRAVMRNGAGSVALETWAPFYGIEIPEVPARFDRFDVCEAYYAIEVDYNAGGWLHERASNRRRAEATSIQLDRIEFSPGLSVRERGYAGLSGNGKGIYLTLCARYGFTIGG